MGGLLDHLVRPAQHRWRDRQTKGLRSLQIDGQFECLRPFYRHFARLRALQDLAHVSATASSGLGHARPIGQETTGLDKLREHGHSGDPFFADEGPELHSVTVGEGPRLAENGPGSSFSGSVQGPFEVLHNPYLVTLDLDRQSAGRLLYRSKLGSVQNWVTENGNTGELGNTLFEQ